MDFLYKQMRGRLSDTEQEKEEESSTTDKKIPPQKSQSFKGVKRTPSWLQKQFSRQISRDYSKEGDEYQAALAAAAFAIQSLEESQSRARKKNAGPVLVSKPDDKPTGLERRRTRSVSFSDEVPTTIPDITDSRVPVRPETMGKLAEKVPSIKKTSTLKEHFSNKVNGETENEEGGKATGHPPSVKKASSFGDTKPGTSIPRPPPPPPPPPTRRITPQMDRTRIQSSVKSGTYHREADAWEKNELTKIKEKYEKISSTIVNWESKKKLKAKRKSEVKEAELDKRKAKTLQNYREQVARVDNIAAGAIARARENQRNEELKVKEKANKIRVTGKPPSSCLCC
ncbi:hypothetical protein Leryth_012479 [Lithospermum erythrorhizon]|nr:hypothetical protein Leryth_012479 [Lithospermum erythrorhizon]